jgi:hypothetical protein
MRAVVGADGRLFRAVRIGINGTLRRGIDARFVIGIRYSCSDMVLPTVLLHNYCCARLAWYSVNV